MSRYDDQVDALLYAWRWLKDVREFSRQSDAVQIKATRETIRSLRTKNKMNDKKYTMQISGSNLNRTTQTGPGGEACVFGNAQWCDVTHDVPLTEVGLRQLADGEDTPDSARVSAKAKLAEIEAERAKESNAKDLETALTTARTQYSPDYCKDHYPFVGLIPIGHATDCHVYYARNAVEAQLWLETPAMFRLLERCRAVLAKLPHGTGLDEYTEACELIDRVKTAK